MYTHFFILDTELTNLNLKSNERRGPYLNFDYLELEYHELSNQREYL